MKFINGILSFAALNGLLVAAVLFKLGYDNIAMVPLVISIFSFAVLIYLYLCKMYLLVSLKRKGRQL